MSKKEVLGEKILIKPEEKEEKIGSIIVPEKAKEKPQKGEIIAAGPGSEAKIGSTVLFNKNAVTEIEYEGEKFLVGTDHSIVFLIK